MNKNIIFVHAYPYPTTRKKEIRLAPNNPLIKLKWKTKAIEKKSKFKKT
ncbi:hypothetical protein [Bacteroides sp. HPS0048]